MPVSTSAKRVHLSSIVGEQFLAWSLLCGPICNRFWVSRLRHACFLRFDSRSFNRFDSVSRRGSSNVHQENSQARNLRCSNETFSKSRAIGPVIPGLSARRLRQGTYVQQFLRGQWLNLRLAHGDYGHGLPHSVEHLQTVAGLLSGTPRMIFHHGGHVSATESVFGQVRLQGYSREWFVFHALSG